MGGLRLLRLLLVGQVVQRVEEALLRVEHGTVPIGGHQVPRLGLRLRKPLVHVPFVLVKEGQQEAVTVDAPADHVSAKAGPKLERNTRPSSLLERNAIRTFKKS